MSYEERLHFLLLHAGPLPGHVSVVVELAREVLHQEVLQVDALHLYEVAQLHLSVLLGGLAERLDLHLSRLLLAPDLELVVDVLDGVSGLEGHLLQFFVERGPKLFGEDEAVVEGIACAVLHLLLEDAVELLDCVVDDLLLLALELPLELDCELVRPRCAPLRPVRDALYAALEVLQGLGLEFLDFFEVLVLAEDLACSLQKLSEAVVSNDIGLLEEALLDLVVQFFLELVPGLVHFLDDVPDSFAVVVLEHFADNGCDIVGELHIEVPLTLLDLIPELIGVDLVGLALDLLAAHAGEQHFLLRQVDVLVLLDGGPDVLHELRQVGDGDVVVDELLVVGAVDQELLEAPDALLPVVLLPLLQLGGQEEDLQLEHVTQAHVRLVGRLGDLAPGVVDLGDELLL